MCFINIDAIKVEKINRNEILFKNISQFEFIKLIKLLFLPYVKKKYKQDRL